MEVEKGIKGDLFVYNLFLIVLIGVGKLLLFQFFVIYLGNEYKFFIFVVFLLKVLIVDQVEVLQELGYECVVYVLFDFLFE